MEKSRSDFAYILTLCGSLLFAVTVVLDAVLFPLETDREPWYYFLFMGCFVFVTIVGLALSVVWRNKNTTSKIERRFSYITLSIGFLLFVFPFIDEQKYLSVGAAGFGLLIVGVATLLSGAIGRNVKVILTLRMNCILRAFPKEVHKSVKKVLNSLKRRRLSEWGIITQYPDLYYGFDKVCLPNKIRLPDREYKTSDLNARNVYYCLQTRNSDGYIREKYLKRLLNTDCPRWAIPFIIEASTDHVAEIVQAVYDGLSEKLKKEIAGYYKNKLQKFRHDYSKTISLWNEYYRADCPNYKDYVGYKLYTECYGFEKRYYKEASLIDGQAKKWNQLWGLYAEGRLEEIPFLLCNYYSGVMGEGHAGFLFNVDNHNQSEDRIDDYVEKLKDVLDEGFYENLMQAVHAYGTKKEAKICDLSDCYFQNREEEFTALLQKYADDIRPDENSSK